MNKKALLLWVLLNGGSFEGLLKLVSKSDCTREIDCLMKDLLEVKRQIGQIEEPKMRIYVLSERRWDEED